jgi:hypothetical protein
MTTVKLRKGPSSSATKSSVGTTKKGNDGNMWKIYKMKNGTRRWLKISNDTSKHKTNKNSVKMIPEEDNIRSKNKRLYHFWLDLANTKYSVFIYNDKSYKIIRNDIREQQEQADNNPNIIAILDSGPSFDAYRELYRKAKNKSVQEVITNYKKYFNEGSIGKRVFC